MKDVTATRATLPQGRGQGSRVVWKVEGREEERGSMDAPRTHSCEPFRPSRMFCMA